MINALDPTDRTIRAIKTMTGFQTDEPTLKRLRQLQQRYRTAVARIELVGENRHARLRQQREHAVSAVKRGRPEEPFSQEYVSHRGAVEAAVAEIEALKAGVVELTSEALALARPEAIRFVREAEEVINALEESERQVASDYLVAFQPSETIVAVRRALKTVVDRLPSPDTLAMTGPCHLCCWEDLD